MPCTTSIYDNLGPAHVLIFGASFGSQLYQVCHFPPISLILSSPPSPHIHNIIAFFLTTQITVLHLRPHFVLRPAPPTVFPAASTHLPNLLYTADPLCAAAAPHAPAGPTGLPHRTVYSVCRERGVPDYSGADPGGVCDECGEFACGGAEGDEGDGGEEGGVGGAGGGGGRKGGGGGEVVDAE